VGGFASLMCSLPWLRIAAVRCPFRFDWRLTDQPADREEQVKSYEEIMAMLEAYDLTGSFRAAGKLAVVCCQYRLKVDPLAPVEN
jgi:hypothetical protein